MKTFFFLVCSMLLQCSIVNAQQLPRALIITGNGNIPKQLDNYPPWTHEFHNEKVIQILEGIVSIDTTTHLTDLNEANLKRYDLIISNSMFLTPDAQQLRALHNFVSKGKAYFTLHCGILTCMNWDGYREFMGGHFIGGPSTEPTVLRVITTNDEFWGFPLAFRDLTEHPISKTLNDFDIKDELYYFQPATPNINVIARAENHPIMWWHKVGTGKVMSLTLGHDLQAKENPGYQELLRNGVRWLTGYPLIYTERIPPVSTRANTYPNFLKIQNISDVQPDQIVSAAVTSDASLLTIRRNDAGNFDLHLTGKSGHGTFTVSVTNKAGRKSERTFGIDIVADKTGNLAGYLGNEITATASENTSAVFLPQNTVDGDTLSRWSSMNTDQAFLLLDLKKQYDLRKIRIHWEASYARNVQILSSIDSKNWTPIYEDKDGHGGVQEATVNANGRYIKLLLQHKVPGKRGFSIYELEIF
ncbi:ThuA domain-containing protein [Chitinophaga horti]|uniref:ThuA domain-containing protein n=1 Tax=Chitinophaga horti TaxID=2920382 RepID=A0ABY6IX62_9BACT|nr:ThuA domain-containing protein [Chitinophaga horti]UYQ91969.1 ThuA domain-containing protein [Chitinophaga horti]